MAGGGTTVRQGPRQRVRLIVPPVKPGSLQTRLEMGHPLRCEGADCGPDQNLMNNAATGDAASDR